MSKDTRTQKLTLLLLKESVKSFRDALSNPAFLTQVPLKADAPYEGAFYYSHPRTQVPGWQGFVAPVLESSLDLTTASVCAVLLVRVEGRIFVFTFGYGRKLLKPDCYELGFGLRVALNRIHHERLRSLDLRTYEDIMVATRKQTSRSAELGAFGLDVSRDLLRAVTGEPDETAFARRITGADALTLTARITVDQLGDKCKQALEAYHDDRYKQYFDWVDQLSEVRDRNVIDALNAELEEAVRTRNTEELHLAPPEVIDWQSVDKFRITGTGQTDYDDLDIDEYLNALGDKTAQLTTQKLKSYRVSVRWTGSEQFQDSWPLFNCIVWETAREGRLYALVEGKWFEIETNFADRVRKFVQSIPGPANPLPDAIAGEAEAQYNQRIAQADHSLACLDGVLVTPEGAPTSIEFCDLLSDKKELIYVKKKTRSATLSHLFAQGTVAARVFLQDGTVRKQIRDRLASMTGDGQFINVIPDETTRPSPPDYKIRYAIITKPTADRPVSLPFFSQLNLMQNAQLLQGLGYGVTLQFVKEPKPDGSSS